MATATAEPEKEPADDRTKPPFLRRIRIRGYKSLAFCDVQLQPLTILVGRNNSGKSNFLDALAFLRDLISAGARPAIEKHGPWSSLLCRTGGQTGIEFEIETNFSSGPFHPNESEDPASSDSKSGDFVATYRLQLAGNRPGVPNVLTESLEIRYPSGALYGKMDIQRNGYMRVSWSSGPGTVPELKPILESRFLVRPDTLVLGSIGMQPFVSLADRIRCIGIHNLDPRAMRLHQRPFPGVMLKEDGSNIASVIETTQEIAPEAVERANDYLSIITPEVESFRRVLYGDFETVAFDLKSGPHGAPWRLDAASMSDGTLRVLGALMAAFQVVLPYGHPSLIGIEEPETSLHPAAAHALISALDAATEHTQVLLTTHSGDLLADRQVSADSVLVVRLREGRTEIAPVDPASRDILREELYTLADLQRQGQLRPDEEDLERQAAEQSKKEG